MIDLAEFWSDSDDNFTNPSPVTQSMIENAERFLGYRLPDSYVRLIRTRNGGTPKRAWFPLHANSRSEDDHVQIRGICGLGGKWGIDSEELGSRFMIGEWGYPDVGIIVCQCPSAGHDAVMLDYSKCGNQGEPRVIHVEVESEEGPELTFLARDFASFIDGLVTEDLLSVDSEEHHPPDVYRLSREVATQIAQEEGLSSRHSSELSDLGFDIQFWLHTNALDVQTKADFVRDYPRILAGFGGGDESSWSRPLLEQWFTRHLERGIIVSRPSETPSRCRLVFADEYLDSIKRRVLLFDARKKATKKKATKKKATKKKTTKKKATKKKATKKKATKKKLQ